MKRDTPFSVYMGYDSRETVAYAVAEYSLKKRASRPFSIIPLEVNNLRERGLLWRQTEIRDGKMWDTISEAPQATEFAITRFLTPYLHKNQNGNSGWAIFMDCDVLSLTDFTEITEHLDPQYAVMCVKHQYKPSSAVKMDGQLQTLYARKNWSSVMAFNCDHPANDALTLSLVNSVPGRDLHAFCWLEESMIGALPPEWNALIGEPGYSIETAKLAHYTLGGPWMDVSLSPKEDKVWNDEYDDFQKKASLAI